MLTRRGRVLVAGSLVAIAMARLFGARALNALVAPALVALLAAVVQLYWLDRPAIRRDLPAHAFVGDEFPVRTSFDVPPVDAAVEDEVDEGLTATGNRASTTVGAAAIEYEVAVDERGERRVGPAHVRVRDVLGLCERAFDYSDTETLLAFPRVRPLRGPARQELASLQRAVEFGNEEFDHLREYVRGDPLRDVHWKSTAKRADDELMVREMDVPEEHRPVTVAAEADAGSADAMAEAAASIVAYLLDAGVAVGLVVPGDAVEPDDADGHRIELLSTLALADAGSVPASRKQDADVVVRATDDGSDVRVTVSERTRPFEAFAEADAAASSASSASSARADGGRREGSR